MKNNKTTLYIITICLISAMILISCKRMNFYIAEEVFNNESAKFTLQDSYYVRGKSIALTKGKFELIPSDSTVLYVQGKSTSAGKSGEGFAEMRLAEIARIYVTLPNVIEVGKYNTKHKALCEITGNLNYQIGENLFICQNGYIAVDSLDGDRIYGRIKGDYLNTKNQSLTIDGDIKATPK